MTREEAKQVFLSRGYVEVEGGSIYDANKWRESCRIISEWLEQQPCDDEVKKIDEWEIQGKNAELWIVKGNLQVRYLGTIHNISLPPVKPQEPKTVLYSGDGYADGYMVYDMAECPNCSYKYEDGDKDWGLSFCPNCGQKLNWERSDHTCHNCKHYTSGERDGSCGSYICKHYSGWESEG